MRIILFISILSMVPGFKQDETRVVLSYHGTTYNCLYHRTQNRFDGPYTSYYRNGKKKAEGHFDNNQRIGKWSVWDSSGKLCVQRIYSDPFTYKQLVPKVPDKKLVRLFNVPVYKVVYNQYSYIDYFDIQQGMVESVRDLRITITPLDNPVLFENSILFDRLCDGVRNDSIDAYVSTYDSHLYQKKIETIDTDSVKLIGYRMRYEWIFDNERLIAEYRPIEFCPIVVKGPNHDTIDFFWIHYWDCRKLLAGIHLTVGQLSENIKTMDDLFFYHYFYGTIYREIDDWGGVENHDTDLPVNERSKKTEQAEIELIEYEHDLWVNFAGGKGKLLSY